MNIFSRITLKTMLQNRTRTLVTIIGVILSAAMITAVISFGTSLLNYLADSIRNTEGPWHFAAFSLTPSEAEALLSDEEVLDGAVVYNRGYARYPGSLESMPYLNIQELSPNAFSLLHMELESGSLPKDSTELLLPYRFFDSSGEDGGFQIGDEITLNMGKRTFQGETLDDNTSYLEGETLESVSEVTLRVSGFYQYYAEDGSFAAGYVGITGSSQATDLSRLPDDVPCSVYMEVTHPKQVYDYVEEHIPEGRAYIFHYNLLRWIGAFDNDNALIVINRLFTLFIAIIMVGSAALIYNAFSISLRERTVQFALLSSIGATRKQLRYSLLTEAFLVSLLGIPLGILSGLLGIGITLRVISRGISSFIFGSSSMIPLCVQPHTLLASILISFATVLVSAWIPAARIRKITPLSALRSANDIRIRPKEVRTSRLVLRLFGLPGVLADKYFKRDRRKCRSTIFSLTVSLTLFVTSTLFTTYLVEGGTFVLDAPSADLVYTFYQPSGQQSSTEDGENRFSDDPITPLLEKNPYVEDFTACKETEFYLRVPKELLGERGRALVSNEDVQDPDLACPYVKVLVLPDETFTSLTGLDAALSQVSAAYYDSFRVYNAATQRYEKQKFWNFGSEPVTLDAGFLSYHEEESGESFSFEKSLSITIAKELDTLPELLADQANNYTPTLVISKTASQFLAKSFAATPSAPYFLNRVYAMKCSDPEKAEETLAADLTAEGFGRNEGNLQNPAKEYADDRSFLFSIRVLTYGFVTLITLIAIANSFNTISTNLSLRRRDYAMLRSVGLGEAAFRRMQCYEGLIFGIRSVIYGSILSLLISFCLYRILLGGLDTSFFLPAKALAIGTAGIFAMIFVTMWIAGRKEKKLTIFPFDT